MNCRVRIQLGEALGPVNRWYCSRAAGRAIEDPELLLAYFIKSGGARDFARRYTEALGALNRWYCSEFYGREVSDPEVLWDYYVHYGELRARCGQRAAQAAGAAVGCEVLSVA